MITRKSGRKGSAMPVPTILRFAAALAMQMLVPALAIAQTSSRVATPATTMQLGIAATGVIEKIFVRDGDHVDAGQLLVTLNCRPLQAEIKVRGANLTAAQAAFERARNGPRPDEIAIGEANVGVARARSKRPMIAPRSCTRALRSAAPTFCRRGATRASPPRSSKTRSGGSISCMLARAPKMFPRPRPSATPPRVSWTKRRRCSISVSCGHPRRGA
jgi:multidrug resistance efflux pump